MAERIGSVEWVTVDENHDGQRLDNFLLSRLKGVPRTRVYRILRKGEVRVNKGRSKPAYRLRIGDIVRIPPLRQSEKPTTNRPEHVIQKIDRSIIYEDNLIIVVNKPSGLAVHGGSGLSYGVIEAMRLARPKAKFLELVHRLDRETSGCLLLAKRRSVLIKLQELQRVQKIEKRYLTLVRGRVRPGAWICDRPLRKNSLKSGERVVRVDATGKPSRTRFRVIQRFAAATLLEATLETGRTHQIRVHAAADGHPILGDSKYGDEAANQHYRALGLRRLFLHASRLRFICPDGPEVKVEASLDDLLQQLLKDLN